MIEAASAASIQQLELQLPMLPAAPTATPAAASQTAAGLGKGLTIASVVGVVGGGFHAGSGGGRSASKQSSLTKVGRGYQPAGPASNLGGLSSGAATVGAAQATAASQSRAGVGNAGSSSSSSRIRPLGQWSRRWQVNTDSRLRRNIGKDVIQVDSGAGVSSRLTTQLEVSPSSGRISGWPAAPLPFGLTRSRPKTSSMAATEKAIQSQTAGSGNADAQKLQRRQSSSDLGAGSATGRQGGRLSGTEGAQTLPMQLIDVRLELPHCRTPRPRRVLPSGNLPTAPRPGSSLTGRESAAPASQAKLNRVQLGDAQSARDFASAAVAQARRQHPMLDACRRRREELVRSTYLLPLGRRGRVPMTPTSLSSSMTSLLPAAEPVIGGIEADDVYSSGLRSRVRSAYFSAAASAIPPPPSTPPLSPSNPVDHKLLISSSDRQLMTSPASRGSSAGSQRTLRSPSPTQQPPPNTAESCSRIRTLVPAGTGRFQEQNNSWREVHIAY